MNIVGRRRELKRIWNYAISEPENKAIFGVKGVGKSTLIQYVFSKDNCKQFADENKVLFVRTILDSKIKGDILIDFLYDRVLNGIDLIGDEDVVASIFEKIDASKDRFQSKDSQLRNALEIIKDYDYSLVLVMDDFHNMGRNTEVGSDQYDFLRSLNELSLIYYWIISDSDFSDVYATSQFITSFFAQKFIPETLPQMTKEDAIELIRLNADKNGVDISDDDLIQIYEIIGGTPGFITSAIKCYELLDNSLANSDEFVELMFENPKCKSILTSWTRSLTREQKDLLFDIAQNHCIYQEQCAGTGIVGKINQLGDNSGLGLIIHNTDDRGKFWSINSRLFSDYILKRTDEFYSNDIIVPAVEQAPQPAPTYIQNNYYTVNNNYFDSVSAYEALISLKNLVANSSLCLPSESSINEAVQKLPYQQPGWNELSEEEQDEQMDEYADKILESDDFSSEGLSENQMNRFNLSEEVLSNMPEICRKNLISAIQVYDVLQYCVDRFGISMCESESARGILFARAYESLLKYSLKPALDSIESIANKEINLEKNKYFFRDAPVNKMTIGNFVFVLNDDATLKKLADICANELGNNSYDFSWWKLHETDIFKIGVLRNECCHSGIVFDGKKLEALIDYLFKHDNVSKVILYNDIRNRTMQ